MKKILQELVVFLLNQKSLTKLLKISGDFQQSTIIVSQVLRWIFQLFKN